MREPTVRQWTGRLWNNTDTLDGRRVAPSFMTEGSTNPIPVRIGLSNLIGKVDRIVNAGGIGVAIGTTTLPPGIYNAAIGATDTEYEIIEGDDTDPIQVMISGHVVYVMITRRGEPAAWSETQIVVHPNPEERSDLPPAVARGPEGGSQQHQGVSSGE